MVLLTRLISFDANASITITRSGCIFSTMPFIISQVSIPVVPRTPGMIALIARVFLSIKSGEYSIKCLVINNFSMVFGPKASGVTSEFPKPTTKTELICSRLINFFIFLTFLFGAIFI